MDRFSTLNQLVWLGKQISNNSRHAKAWYDENNPEAEKTSLENVQRDLTEAQSLLNQLLSKKMD